jgi:hypothetical protein
MKKLIVNVPDHYTDKQILKELSKKILSKSKLLGGKQINLLIGNVVEVSHLQHTIEINKIPPPIPPSKECSICGCTFIIKEGATLFTNYGGVKRPIYFCSSDCGDIAIGINPERIGTSRQIKPSFLYQH